jgi:hypothetical protein
MPKNLPYDFPELFKDFAAMPRFADDIEALTQLAEPEDWDYKHTTSNHSHPILRSYISYTYRRVAAERKISITADEEYACWNTGLITSGQEPIFILFSKNKIHSWDQYWHFSKFVRRGEWELNRFPALPDMAHYFDDPSVLVLDTRKDFRINVEHVVSDNFGRFPSSLQSMNTFGLQNIVVGAKDAALQRVRRNYKTAVPQYYQGSIQLLLPLSLTDPAIADSTCC